MCTCKPRLIKTASNNWVRAACTCDPRPPVELVTLVRTDASTGTSVATSLAVFRHDLDGADECSALEALVTLGEALTPAASYAIAE